MSKGENMVERLGEIIASGVAHDLPSASIARLVLAALADAGDEITIEGARVALTLELRTASAADDHRVLTEAERAAIGLGDAYHGNPAKWYAPHWRAMIFKALGRTILSQPNDEGEGK